MQLTLSLRMTTAQVVETSVTVNNNSSIQDYVHTDDQTQPTFFNPIVCLTFLLLSPPFKTVLNDYSKTENCVEAPTKS